MAFQSVPDCAQATVICTINDVVTNTTLGMHHLTGQYNQTDINLLADGLDAWFGTEVRAFLASAAVYQQVDVRGLEFIADLESTANTTAGIGADTNDRATFNYGPSHSSNISEPWVWRRSWILGRSTVAPSVVAPNALVEGAFPSSNTFGYNAPNEGTHIDAKVGRRIRKEERLWFSIQAHPISMRESLNAPDTEFVCQVGGYLDIRILGTIVRNSKRSVF